MVSGFIGVSAGKDRFKYEAYSVVDLPEWRAYFESDEFREVVATEDGSRKPDPFEGNVIVVFWNVIERLINEELFSKLSMSSPFRVGFQFHDAHLIVLRILNWPPHEGPRV